MQFKLEQVYPRRWIGFNTHRSHQNKHDFSSMEKLVRRLSPASRVEAPKHQRYDSTFLTVVPYGVFLKVNDIIEITGYPKRKIYTEIKNGNLDKVKPGLYVNRYRRNPPPRRLTRIRMVKWRYLVRQYKENTVTPETMVAAFGGTEKQWRENIGW